MSTRLFFATDIHGSEKCFKKFLNAGKFYKANVLILGGDMTGKMIVPIVEQAKGKGNFKCHFMGKDYIPKNKDELDSLWKSIQDSGFYPYLTNSKEVEELNADRVKMNKLFSRLMVETLERWLEMAEERLKSTGVKCYMTGGNDDPLEIERVLNKSSYVINAEGKVVDIDENHEMVSSGYSNMTPWKCPRDITEEKLAKKIEAVTSKVKNMQSCIFNLHCPPYNTDIDTAVELDKNLKPVVRGMQVSEIPVGSTAVRAAIEKRQPLLGLHGHIHESRGYHKLGRTLCLNPGSEYSEGILRGAIVTLDKDVSDNYVFTSG